MGKVTYGDFSFPKEFGFSGSGTGRADAKSRPKQSSDEFGDGLAKGGPACMAKGGPIKKQIGGMIAPAGALQAVSPMLPRQQGAPVVLPAQAAPLAARPSGMAKGGKAKKNFIAGAIRHPGALHRSLGVPEGQKIPAAKIEKAAHSKNPTLARRARFAQTLKGLSKK